MKTLLALILFCSLTALAQIQPAPLQWMEMAATPKAASGGGTCSPAEGNVLTNEGFETITTGYQQAGWQAATGSPNPAASISGLTGAPDGSCTQGFEAIDTGVSRQFGDWSSGGNHNGVIYERVYFYIKSTTLDAGHYAIIFGTFHSSISIGDADVYVRIINSGSQLQVQAVGSTSSSTAVNISTGQWILVEIKDTINTSSCAMKVNGGSELTFDDSASYSNWSDFGLGTIITSGSISMDIVFDEVALGTSGYIGAVP